MSGEGWRITVPMVMEQETGSAPLTANDRLHPKAKGRLVAKIRTEVGWTAKAKRIPPQEHITVQLHYRPGDNRRRDAPNLVAASKPAVDALVDAGVVPDDTARWVTELMPVIHEGPGKRELWLSVVPGRAS